MTEDSLCEDCIYLLHYKYDREVDISCQKGHDARFYPPILKCNDFKLQIGDALE